MTFRNGVKVEKTYFVEGIDGRSPESEVDHFYIQVDCFIVLSRQRTLDRYIAMSIFLSSEGISSISVTVKCLI